MQISRNMTDKHIPSEYGCIGAKGLECPGAVGCEQLDNDVELMVESRKIKKRHWFFLWAGFALAVFGGAALIRVVF